MKISYNWLKDYINSKITAEKAAEALTMAGLAVESVTRAGDDHILELEVTANRPDWLSYIGVARELAAITGAKLKAPAACHCEDAKRPKQSLNRLLRRPPASSQRQIEIKIKDKALCPRYTARVIKGVKVGESPAWLKSKLEAMGLRPVNNIVDVTNFCLFETGEPMHAFDMDKITNGEIVVRRSRKGERITTIDGGEKTLDDSSLVIADGARAVAIAGVMGALNTEVTLSTKNILLEAASFDPISVRRTARKLGISTESSYRFERKVDGSNIGRASDRAASLILELAGGQAGEFVDIGERQKAKEVVGLNHSKLNKVLGIDIPAVKVKSILNSLGLKTRGSSGAVTKFEIPGFRNDLHAETDLIEEVARIYGYGRIPETIPNIVEQPVRMPPDLVTLKKIRCILVGLGLDETITYSLMSKKTIAGALVSTEGMAELANPLTIEQEAMRTSLMPGMLGTIAWNINRKIKDLRVFEMGRVYIKEGPDSFAEPRHLAIGMAGLAHSDWVEGSREVNVFDLKGVAERLFCSLGIRGAEFKPADDASFSGGACASIEVGAKKVGVIGEVSKKVLANFDIKERIYVLEIDLDAMLPLVKLAKHFEELPKYPSVIRDISIIIGKGGLNSDLINSIKNTAGAILKKVSLIDRYSGKQIPDGKVGLTYRLEYQDLTKTLEEKTVSDAHTRILGELEARFGARLR